MSWTMRQERGRHAEARATVVLGCTLAEQSPAEASRPPCGSSRRSPAHEQAAGNLLWTLARTDLDRAMRLFESLSIEQQSEHMRMPLRQQLVRPPVAAGSAFDWALSLDRRIRARGRSRRCIQALVLPRITCRNPAIARRHRRPRDTRTAAAPRSGPADRSSAMPSRRWPGHGTSNPRRSEKSSLCRCSMRGLGWTPATPVGNLLETRGGPTRDRAAATHDAKRRCPRRAGWRNACSIPSKRPNSRPSQRKPCIGHFTDIDPRHAQGRALPQVPAARGRWRVRR